MACCIFALAILIAPAAIAQSMVSGTVVDGQNEPVIGASVMVKGTTSGVATGIDGDFLHRRKALRRTEGIGRRI